MSILINKQLQRPDKGALSSGSIVDGKPMFIPDALTISWSLIHWFNQLAKDTAKEDGWLPVVGVTNFSYKVSKKCTEEEWAKLDDVGAATLVELWLKDIIDNKIGVGFTEII